MSLVFILDQGTKFLVTYFLPLNHHYAVVPNFFDLVHILNRGAAFGLFSQLPDPYRFIFLTGIAVFACVLIFIYYLKLPPNLKTLEIPLASIVGGGLGNLLDRFIYGGVVDFLAFRWRDFWIKIDIKGYYWHMKLEWPSFNVADIAISLSALWLLAVLTRTPEEKKASEAITPEEA